MKRFLSLLLALVMSFALAIPAFAVDSGDPDEGIMPLGRICPNCGGNVTTTYDWNSTPSKVESVECQHNYPYGDDLVYTYEGKKHEKCVRCMQGPSITVTRTEVKCFGHYA